MFESAVGVWAEYACLVKHHRLNIKETNRNKNKTNELVVRKEGGKERRRKGGKGRKKEKEVNEQQVYQVKQYISYITIDLLEYKVLRNNLRPSN